MDSLRAVIRHPHDQRGAAIVEFALVAVILFTIIFGLIEGGILVRARNTLNSATDDAARRGSIAGNDPAADWMILQQLRARGAHTALQINFVVVYRADVSAQPPSAACRAGTPIPGECNVYDRAEMELPSGAFGCGDANLDANWCPTTRSTDPRDLQYLGVWVDATHRGLTGLFGDVEMEAHSGLPLEGSGGI